MMDFNHVIFIGIDGLGASFLKDEFNPYLSKFFKNGSIVYVDANIPTDSAENWGSILTGVTPRKHGLKLENLLKPYSNKNYPSLFKLLCGLSSNFKMAAFSSWEKIITGMIECDIDMRKYAPKLNENIMSRIWMKFNHHVLKNPIYDTYLIPRLLEYVEQNEDVNFLFIHLVDLDETGHLFNFGSDNYYKKLKTTDDYVKIIIENVEKVFKNPLIIISTDHGGLGKSHGGNSDFEKNVFIGSNGSLNRFTNINSNMSCASIILDCLNFNRPLYFDDKPQR